MKITSLIRVIKFGFKNFWRNIWLALATTFVMMLTLFTVSSLIVLSLLGRGALNFLKEKVDISVYLKNEAKEGETDEIRENLSSLPEVKSIDFISKEETLASFKKEHQGSPMIISSIEELDKNPLQPSLVIKARYPEDYVVISDFLKKEQYKNVIDKITFEDNKNVIDKITQTSDLMEKVGLVISLIFSFITVVFMFNTIRLTIYAQKDEIKVMRLIGAKNLFIRFPFIIEGILYALIASIFSSMIIYFLSKYSFPYIVEFVGNQDFNTHLYLNRQIGYLFLFQLVFGMILAITSSYIALRKYLKV